MRHRISGKRLSRSADHRKALLRNLATSLVLHGKLTTTTAKAKALKAYFERLVSRVLGANDMNAIRMLSSEMFTSAASKKFLVVARGLTATSGWLRTTKVGVRDGDAADMTMVEIIQ